MRTPDRWLSRSFGDKIYPQFENPVFAFSFFGQIVFFSPFSFTKCFTETAISSNRKNGISGKSDDALKIVSFFARNSARGRKCGYEHKKEELLGGLTSKMGVEKRGHPL